MKNNKKYLYSTIAIILLVVLIVSGNMFLEHKAKEDFYSSYNKANEDYKVVLFATGQEKPESSQLLSTYEKSWNEFYIKYKESPISDFKTDNQWTEELDEINSHIINARTKVDENKLHEAHLELEHVREKFQEVFTKNHVTMLGTYLTDFHDKMEIAIALEEQGYNQNNLQKQCYTLTQSLNVVKETQVDLDQDYTSKLNTLNNDLLNFCKSNNYNQYLDNGVTLKKSFISIYLKYG